MGFLQELEGGYCQPACSVPELSEQAWQGLNGF